MRKLLFILLFALIYSCKKEPSLEENFKSVCSTYLLNELPKDSLVIDSIIVEKIDTLTQFKVLALKLDCLNQEFQRLSQVQELNTSLYSLQYEAGITTPTLKKENEKELQAGIDKMTKIHNKSNELMEEMKKADTVKFVFYNVDFKVIYTNKSLIQKTGYKTLVISKDFKIKDEEIRNVIN